MGAKRPRSFFAVGQKILFVPGCVQGDIISSVCVSVSVCATFAVFADCESCTGPISTNLGSMEAGEYGLCVGRVSSHAVSSWKRSPGCCRSRDVFWVGRMFFPCFFFDFLFLERARPAAGMRPSCLIYLSTSNEAIFCL